MFNWIVRAGMPALGEEFCRRLLAAAAAECRPPADSAAAAPRLAVALTGGSSAGAFYRALAAHASAWAPDSIDFFWSDERMVPPDDPDSNFLLARQALLDPCAVPAGRIHRVPTELPAETCAVRYAEQLRARLPGNDAGVPVFPLILLGLGADGHTASLFPHTDIFAGDNLLVRTAAGTADHPHPRITFTPRLINAARRVWFLISGEQKAQAVLRLYERSGGEQLTPALVVDGSASEVTFFVEEGAARLLPPAAAGDRG